MEFDQILHMHSTQPDLCWDINSFNYYPEMLKTNILSNIQDDYLNKYHL